jgi:hypothetical protein
LASDKIHYLKNADDRINDLYEALQEVLDEETEGMNIEAIVGVFRRIEFDLLMEAWEIEDGSE